MTLLKREEMLASRIEEAKRRLEILRNSWATNMAENLSYFMEAMNSWGLTPQDIGLSDEELEWEIRRARVVISGEWHEWPALA